MRRLHGRSAGTPPASQAQADRGGGPAGTPCQAGQKDEQCPAWWSPLLGQGRNRGRQTGRQERLCQQYRQVHPCYSLWYPEPCMVCSLCSPCASNLTMSTPAVIELQKCISTRLSSQDASGRTDQGAGQGGRPLGAQLKQAQAPLPARRARWYQGVVSCGGQTTHFAGMKSNSNLPEFDECKCHTRMQGVLSSRRGTCYGLLMGTPGKTHI